MRSTDEKDLRPTWLVLLYQFPQQPGSLRMKIWRRLQRIGAVAVKNSVYVLPLDEQTREDFEWVLQEITSGGAEGAILEANFIGGMEDQQLHGLFDAARDADYAALAGEVREFQSSLSKNPDEDQLSDTKNQLMRFRKRLSEIDTIDFFGANGREATEGVIASLAEQITSTHQKKHKDITEMPKSIEGDLIGKIWVTRRNVHVDRIASAWLVGRWIDSDASFKFTSSKKYEPQDDELRFDMFEAEITHEGDNCTFEVLLSRANLDDPALKKIGEIIHDIDLKDSKFSHDETPGIEHLLAGLIASSDSDEERIKQGGAIFNNLHKYFSEAKK